MPHTAWATIATATSFRPCNRPEPDRSFERARTIGEENEKNGGRQRESGPGGKAAESAGTHQSEREPDLAARRAGQELAQRDEIGIGLLVEPAPAHHEFVAEIADMSDRTAEAADPQFEEDQQDLERGTPSSLGQGGLLGSRHRSHPSPFRRRSGRRSGIKEERGEVETRRSGSARGWLGSTPLRNLAMSRRRDGKSPSGSAWLGSDATGPEGISRRAECRLPPNRCSSSSGFVASSAGLWRWTIFRFPSCLAKSSACWV